MLSQNNRRSLRILSFTLALTLPWAGLGDEPTNEVHRLPTVTIIGDEPQSAATSITTVSGDRMQNGEIQSVRDLNGIAPNVTVFDANNNRIPKFSVRGLRENNFSVGEAALGLYVDDVPCTDLNSRGLPLYEIEKVEFLRGPQGTLYGASGPGGLISIKTRQPDNDWHGYGGVSYGNYGSQNYQAGIRGPIIEDQLYLGLAGARVRRDGFVQNEVRGSHPDDRESLAGRALLRWTPAEQWDITLSATAERNDDGLVPTFNRANDANAYSISRDFEGFVDTRSFVQALRIGYTHEKFMATSITSHRDWEQHLEQDFDFSAAPVTIGFSRPELEQWSQEIRLQSPDTADKVQWLGGFYFTDKTLETDSGSVLPSGIPPFIPPGAVDRTMAKFDDQAYALFGQATLTLDEKLDLTSGLRLEHNEKEMRRTRLDDTAFLFGRPPVSMVNLDDDFSAVLPKAGVAYRFNNDHTGFFNAAAGFQSGGFNASNNDPSQADYDSSYSWNFELGLNSAWCDERLFTRLALFYSHFDDYQVFRFNQGDPTLAYLVNADRASAYGAELEMEAHPTENLEISIALGVTEAEFDDFSDPVNGANFDHKDINFVPQFTANFAAQYRFPCGFFARGEVRGVGEYYLDEGNTARQGAFALVNAQLGYEWKNFQVYVFGNNLLDKEYYNNALDLRSAPQPDLLIRQPGDPLMFGAALTARF